MNSGNSQMRFFSLLLVLTCLSGCGDEPQITAYESPKIQLNEAGVRPSVRMLGAILPREKDAWFLKVTGEEKAVAALHDQFRQLAQSITFADGKPSWSLPEKWQEQPGDAMRYRTILIPGSPPLELTVSTLPFQGELNEYLLANINRWRRQLGLDPVRSRDLSQETETSQGEGGNEIYFVHYLGDPVAAARAGMPGGNLPPQHPPVSSAQPSGATSPERAELATHPPSGWTPGQLNSIRKAAYEVQEGGQRAEVTVSKLTSAAGDVPDNVSIWRDQVGLPKASREDIAANVKSLQVLGQDAAYVQLEGPESGTGRLALLGVIAPRGEDVWFVKMLGDAELVQRERERFETFAQSLEVR